MGYLVDAKAPIHLSIQAAYQLAVKQRRQMVTTNYIIAELVAVLESRQRIPRQQIFRFIDQLKSTPFIEIIHIDQAVDGAAWDLLKVRPDKAWSLVDASSFDIMQQRGINEAMTTDHHFQQAGFIALPYNSK